VDVHIQRFGVGQDLPQQLGILIGGVAAAISDAPGGDRKTTVLAHLGDAFQGQPQDPAGDRLRAGRGARAGRQRPGERRQSQDFGAAGGREQDAHLWADTYEHKLQAPFRIQEEIASAVAEALALELGERTRRLLGREGTTNPDALEFYRRGRFLKLRTGEAQEQALAIFERAIALDSGYADATPAFSWVTEPHQVLRDPVQAQRHQNPPPQVLPVTDRRDPDDCRGGDWCHGRPSYFPVSPIT
jgi:hypothetical protein